jgi:hypothetical protein
VIAFNLLAGIGATLILVRSVIFRRVRRIWPELLQCSQCMGFWVGAAIGLAQRSTPTDWILYGCATSFLSLLAEGVLSKLLGDPDEQEKP